MVLGIEALKVRDDARRLLADVKICAESSDNESRIGELVREFASFFVQFELAFAAAFIERNNRTNTYLHTLKFACDALASSRKAEVLCPYPGCIQQRIESSVYLDHLCQCLRGLCERLTPSRTWVITKDLLCMADSFLQATECKDDYTCKGLSDMPSSVFPVKIELLFGPVPLMAPRDQAEMVRMCMKLMIGFDRLISDLRAIPANLTAFSNLSASLKERIVSVNSCATMIRNRYMPPV